MKYIEEYRDAEGTKKLAQKIRQITRSEWKIMEVCGGQTHAIIKFGIDQILPKKIELIHGPGCPVCVTPLELIDKALEIAAKKDVIFCSFGDMLRVPGSKYDLFSIKASGGDIRILYSPLDALQIALKNPKKQVVFFAVGFETTAPANAMAVWQAKAKKIKNFFLLVSHVLVPPAIEAILSSNQNLVNGFLAAGHVCSIMGYHEYPPIAKKYKVPIVVTGFEPIDILHGIYLCVKQLESGKFFVENQYSRSVVKNGNLAAQKMLNDVFEIDKRQWRGIGAIPKSGFRLKKEFSEFDAEKKYSLEKNFVQESTECISGQIMQGIKKPNQCPQFGKKCTPETPLGATMVSNEGACSAYFRYRKT